jgi:hypothetical protein
VFLPFVLDRTVFKIEQVDLPTCCSKAIECFMCHLFKISWPETASFMQHDGSSINLCTVSSSFEYEQTNSNDVQNCPFSLFCSREIAVLCDKCKNSDGV